jgi:hypothetical protein
MPADLICGEVNFNDTTTVNRVLTAAAGALSEQSNWHRLFVRNYYFSTPDGPLPRIAGWYFICDEATALYVGEAEDLNARLNSTNGSLDNFANSRRTQDPARNFIKRFANSGIISNLRVGIVTEECVCGAAALRRGLSKHDRCNIEKVFGLFRHTLTTGSSTDSSLRTQGPG